VNNCGGPLPGVFDSISEEQWRSHSSSLPERLRMTRAALPGMRAARWGRIINIVSTSVVERYLG